MEVVPGTAAPLVFDPDKTSLGDLFDCGISKHRDIITKVATDATAEAQIELSIHALDAAWEATVLPVLKIDLNEHNSSSSDDARRRATSRRGGTNGEPAAPDTIYELGPLDDVANPNDHRAAFRAIAMGEHGMALKPLITVWRQRLDRLTGVRGRTSTGSSALKPMLAGEREGALAHAWARFNNRRRRDSSGARGLLNMPEPPSDLKLKQWKLDVEVLDEIKAELKDHLEMKRVAFPRFYYLSDLDLISALGNLRNQGSQTLSHVVLALPALFDAVVTLDRSLEPESDGDANSANSSERAAGRARSDLGVVARQMNAVLPVGVEYVGSAPRTVVTPLGARCVLGLTTAIQALRGVAVVGPHGVGKAEICKDLANTLMSRCVSRAPSDFGTQHENAVKAINHMFAGTAATGAWLVLGLGGLGHKEGGHRYVSRILGAVAAHLQLLMGAVAMRANTVKFAGKDVPLKSFVSRVEKGETDEDYVSYSGMPLIAVTSNQETEAEDERQERAALAMAAKRMLLRSLRNSGDDEATMTELIRTMLPRDDEAIGDGEQIALQDREDAAARAVEDRCRVLLETDALADSSPSMDCPLDDAIGLARRLDERRYFGFEYALEAKFDDDAPELPQRSSARWGAADDDARRLHAPAPGGVGEPASWAPDDDDPDGSQRARGVALIEAYERGAGASAVAAAFAARDARLGAVFCGVVKASLVDRTRRGLDKDLEAAAGQALRVYVRMARFSRDRPLARASAAASGSAWPRVCGYCRRATTLSLRRGIAHELCRELRTASSRPRGRVRRRRGARGPVPTDDLLVDDADPAVYGAPNAPVKHYSLVERDRKFTRAMREDAGHATGHANVAGAGSAQRAVLVQVGERGVGRRSVVDVAAHLCRYENVFHSPPPPVFSSADGGVPVDGADRRAGRQRARGWALGGAQAGGNHAEVALAEYAARVRTHLRVVVCCCESDLAPIAGDSTARTRPRARSRGGAALCAVDRFDDPDEAGCEAARGAGSADDDRSGRGAKQANLYERARAGAHRQGFALRAAATQQRLCVAAYFAAKRARPCDGPARRLAAPTPVALRTLVVATSRPRSGGLALSTASRSVTFGLRKFSEARAATENLATEAEQAKLKANAAFQFTQNSSGLLRSCADVFDEVVARKERARAIKNRTESAYNRLSAVHKQSLGTSVGDYEARRATRGDNDDTPGDTHAEKRHAWAHGVAQAERALADPSTVASSVRRMGQAGLAVGVPVSVWVRCCCAAWKALCVPQTLAAWASAQDARKADAAASEKHALELDAFEAAQVAEKAAKVAVVGGARRGDGRAQRELGRKHRTALGRFKEIESTLMRWDGRAAALAAQHAALPASRRGAAAGVSFARRCRSAEPPLRLCGNPAAAAPALCAAERRDACDFGGSGDGGVPLRRWEGKGLLPGGSTGNFALGVAAVATELQRVPLLIDPCGDGAVALRRVVAARANADAHARVSGRDGRRDRRGADAAAGAPETRREDPKFLPGNEDQPAPPARSTQITRQPVVRHGGSRLILRCAVATVDVADALCTSANTARHLISVVDLAPDITDVAKRLAAGAVAAATHGPFADVTKVARIQKEASFMAAIAARDDDDGLLAIAEDLDPLALSSVPNKSTGEENTPLVGGGASEAGLRAPRDPGAHGVAQVAPAPGHGGAELADAATAYADVIFAVDALLGDGVYSGNARKSNHATRATAALAEHVSRFAAVVHSGRAGKLVTRDEAAREAVAGAWALERPNDAARDDDGDGDHWAVVVDWLHPEAVDEDDDDDYDEGDV
ncbi:hypothetical protein JL720_3953 [Aureococcus anophagefferens]|nr:hypothetical protein JL720_3953 [Aureococcus anophagefferens]